MYKQTRDLEGEILHLLVGKRFYIKQIADELKISRVTADKYLSRLEAKRLVECEFVGIAKLYWVSE